ncbi:transposase and inactivated derivative [Candidatus Scalindua japonica]|uniref:Transposase and inactivated derivative n=1 Tax=Candidatus Scalindua japonica TaxID=1284222 RepID=A0A286U3Q5_9BACT|nr:transposase and inactivated derivative [Candidatus Scalindua japonica]
MRKFKIGWTVQTFRYELHYTQAQIPGHSPVGLTWIAPVDCNSEYKDFRIWQESTPVGDFRQEMVPA